jgi:membrane-associated phospholipid phosphatase
MTTAPKQPETPDYKPLLRRLAVAFVLVLAFCVVSYLWIDRPLALWFKANLAPPWSIVLDRITRLGLGGVWLIPAGVCAVVFRWLQISAKTDRAERNWRLGANGAFFLFATVAASGLTVDLLKGVIGRLRPYELFQHHLYGFAPLTIEWSRNSFPSGHGQTAFAALSAFAVALPRWRVPLFAAAILIAASRVILSVHYLSDVAMGSFLGLAGTLLLARLFAAHDWELRLD